MPTDTLWRLLLTERTYVGSLCLPHATGSGGSASLRLPLPWNNYIIAHFSGFVNTFFEKIKKMRWGLSPSPEEVYRLLDACAVPAAALFVSCPCGFPVLGTELPAAFAVPCAAKPLDWSFFLHGILLLSLSDYSIAHSTGIAIGKIAKFRASGRFIFCAIFHLDNWSSRVV